MAVGGDPTVAVVVPLSSRPTLLDDERISLAQLTRHLGHYDKYVVAPVGAAFTLEGFSAVRFPTKFFGSVAAHNNLLFWPGFYKPFSGYDYILFYHLDSLVFDDQLREWCAAGLDYIGPPWLPGPDTPWVERARVGNGGFTLLRVASVLRVLRARHRKEPWSVVSDLVTRNSARFAPLYRVLERIHRVAPRTPLVARALAHRARGNEPARYGWNHDQFLSFHATDYVPSFRIATVEQGLRFAFEAAPRVCLQMNGNRLPFGCHAWTRYDREFWESRLAGSAAIVADGGELCHTQAR